MMSMPFELQHEDNSPLDLIEELAEAKGWTFSRSDEDFLVIRLPGHKLTYEVCMEWQEEFSSLLFSCAIPVEITDNNYETAAQTLEQINQNIWLGHFDLSAKPCHPCFRYTFLFRMIPSGIAVDIVNDVLDIALAECDRFYTTFQLVQTGDVHLRDNLHAAIFETVGEA